MKYKKALTILLFGSFMMMFVLSNTIPVLADVGNSFTGGSGGGGSYGGGSFGGGSYGGYGGGGSFMLFASPSSLIFLVIIMVLVIASRSKASNNQRNGGYSNPGIQPNLGFDETATIADIKANDPEFSAEEFRSFASEVWLTLQEAWEAKDWQKVRPFESNALFNVHNRQLQEYITQKKTNYMNMQNIRDVKIAIYRVDQEFEILRVKLDASLLDYVKDDQSGKVIEGSSSEYVYRSYNLEFIRTANVKTKHQDGNAVTNCPNCGAPTHVTSSGECEYCKSVITTGEFGWVLNKYAPWQ